MKLNEVAVFSRNHRRYLAEAALRRRDEITTFRSKVRWATASEALRTHGPRTIYFAEVGGDSYVTYKADLVDMILEPRESSPATKRLLKHELAVTGKRGEKLWGGEVKTLYAIANCYLLPRAFPQTSLVLINTGALLDANYGRSYALVRAKPDRS